MGDILGRDIWFYLEGACTDPTAMTKVEAWVKHLLEKAGELDAIEARHAEAMEELRKQIVSHYGHLLDKAGNREKAARNDALEEAAVMCDESESEHAWWFSSKIRELKTT